VEPGIETALRNPQNVPLAGDVVISQAYDALGSD
jgi:hypothetical protein